MSIIISLLESCIIRIGDFSSAHLTERFLKVVASGLKPMEVSIAETLSRG